jgi:hypothetical protein
MAGAEKLEKDRRKRLADFIEPFRVKPGSKVTLAKDFDPSLVEVKRTLEAQTPGGVAADPFEQVRDNAADGDEVGSRSRSGGRPPALRSRLPGRRHCQGP